MTLFLAAGIVWGLFCESSIFTLIHWVLSVVFSDHIRMVLRQDGRSVGNLRQRAVKWLDDTTEGRRGRHQDLCYFVAGGDHNSVLTKGKLSFHVLLVHIADVWHTRQCFSVSCEVWQGCWLWGRFALRLGARGMRKDFPSRHQLTPAVFQHRRHRALHGDVSQRHPEGEEQTGKDEPRDLLNRCRLRWGVQGGRRHQALGTAPVCQLHRYVKYTKLSVRTPVFLINFFDEISKPSRIHIFKPW